MKICTSCLCWEIIYIPPSHPPALVRLAYILEWQQWPEAKGELPFYTEWFPVSWISSKSYTVFFYHFPPFFPNLIGIWVCGIHKETEAQASDEIYLKLGLSYSLFF